MSDILLFGSSHCAPCVVVKHKLNAYNIAYTYVDVDSDEGVLLTAKYGISSVPTMVMGDGEEVAIITGSAINEELARILK